VVAMLLAISLTCLLTISQANLIMEMVRMQITTATLMMQVITVLKWTLLRETNILSLLLFIPATILITNIILSVMEVVAKQMLSTS